MKKKLEVDIQIRFADVDRLGHVNNVNLQHYFDLGKMQFYSAIAGVDVNPTDKSLILVATDTNYFAQTLPSAHVFVETSLAKIGTKSITLYQRLIDRRTGVVYADCQATAVAFDFERQESIEILPEWRLRLEEYQ